MGHHPRRSDPDMILVSYKSASNRSTRLLLLEWGAEMLLEAHGECDCEICRKFKEAFKLKGDPPWKKDSTPTAA